MRNLILALLGIAVVWNIVILSYSVLVSGNIAYAYGGVKDDIAIIGMVLAFVYILRTKRMVK